MTEPGKLVIQGATLSAKSFETDAGISLATLQNALNMLVPIGTIMAYGGDTSNADIVSQLAAQGWLPCDGRAVSKTTYADLFKVVGNSFGAEGRLEIWAATATSGPTNVNRVFKVTNPDGFRVPDLRGRFLRGTDQGQKRDPDAVLRQDLVGGEMMATELGRLRKISSEAISIPLTPDTVMVFTGLLRRIRRQWLAGLKGRRTPRLFRQRGAQKHAPRTCT